MSLLNRLRTVLVKIESTYGVDPTPTGAANAVLCSQPDVTPIEGQTVPRDLLRAYFGNSEQLPTAVYSKVALNVEIAGSGTEGTAPAWGPLLRACGFAETALATALADTAQAGGTNTITLAATESASDDAYLGMKITTTGGTGSGQTRTIVNYDGATKIATVDRDWTVTPDATTTYAVAKQVAYAPVSASFESVTIYFNVNGVLHKLLGARGTVKLGLTADQVPVFNFEFSGIYVDASDAAAPTVTLTGWQQPLVVNKVNTPEISLHGYSATMRSMSMDAANDVVFRSLPGGSEAVNLTDRKPTGDINVEAVLVATKDYFSTVRNATLGSVIVEHGTAAGNTVRVTGPSVQLTTPRYVDDQGIAHLQTNTVPLPLNGNDDILISAL